MSTRDIRSPAPLLRSLTLTAAIASSLIGTAASANCPPPGPAATVDAALHHAELDRPIEARLRRRARLAHILPNVARLEARSSDADITRAESRLDQELDPLLESDAADLTDWLRSGVDVRQDARVVLGWDLSALVWANSDLQIERLARELRAERAMLAERVLDIYFRWRRAHDARSSQVPQQAAPDDAARDAALLDYLTGGWFGTTARCVAPSPYLP